MSDIIRNKRSMLLALVVGILVITSCQPAPPPTPQVVEVTRIVAGTPQTIVTTATPPPAAATGPVKITVWNYLVPENYPQIVPIYEAYNKQFMADHPGVTVEMYAPPYEGSDAKYAAAFAGRTGAPDVFIGRVTYLAGGLGVADPAPKDVSDCWDSHAVEIIKPYLKYNGAYYGFPLETDLGMMLFYNKDMFTEAGLDPNKPPQTFDELLADAKKLTKTDAAGNITQEGFAVRFSGNARGIADKWLPFLHAWGGRLYAEDGSTSQGYLNSPEAVASLDYYAGLVTKDKVASLSLGKPDDAFPKKQAAMFFREAWMVGVLRDTAPDINYGVAPLPKQQVNPGFSLLFEDGYMVYKFSPNKDMAWQWLKGLTCDQNISLEQAKAAGILPTFKELWSDPYMSGRPDIAVENAIMTNPAGPVYETPYINDLSFRVGQAIQEAMFGQKTAQKALDDAVSDVDAILGRSK